MVQPYFKTIENKSTVNLSWYITLEDKLNTINSLITLVFNNMQIVFYDLFDRPDMLPLVAQWTYEEWWSNKPHKTVEMVVNAWKKRIVDSGIPLTLVGELDHKLVGMVSLVDIDVGMEHRTDLWPWVSAVYVLPEYRRQGVGGALLEAITSKVVTLGIRSVYLYTYDQTEFYKSYGWSILEKEQSGNQSVDILHKNLSLNIGI